MIVIDEYLAVGVVGGAWPEGLPDDEDLGLPASRHWRLLQRVHAPGDGQLSQILAQLSDAGRDGIRHPHPEVLGVLGPWPLLDDAAALAARYGGDLLIAETLAAGSSTVGGYSSARRSTSAVTSPPPPAISASPSTSSPDRPVPQRSIPAPGQNSMSHTDAPEVWASPGPTVPTTA